VKLTISLLMPTAILLAGCSGSAVTGSAVPVSTTRTPVPTGTAPAPGEATEVETRVDEQGAVIFAITPLNLDSPDDTLDFEVVMETHSVDLAWDLAMTSTLQTDTGVEVQAITWPIGSGHHYSATLLFPATTSSGESVLAGVKVLTLIIRETDVPERLFAWDLGS